MITKQEVFEGLYGAWRLVLGDRSAMALFDDSVLGFWKSFFAAAIVSPMYALLIIMGVIEFETSRSVPAMILLNIEFYIIGWVLWPLIIGYIVPALDRDEEYALYIVAYNWANVIGASLFFITITASAMLPISAGFSALLTGVVTIGLLTYHVFIARVALDSPLGGAVGLTICEFVIGQIILIVQQGVLM